MSSDVEIGAAARMMMENTTRSKVTSRKELRAALNTSNIDGGVTELRTMMVSLGLDIKCLDDGFILVRSSAIRGARMGETMEKLSYLLALIALEKGSIEKIRLERITEGMFGKDEARRIFNAGRSMKYIRTERIDDAVNVTFGWRYWVDFEDVDTMGYFEDGGASS